MTGCHCLTLICLIKWVASVQRNEKPLHHRLLVCGNPAEKLLHPMWV